MNPAVTNSIQLLKSFTDIERVTLHNTSGLKIELFPNGALCAITHEDCLINQVLGVPPEGCPFRLWLRDDSGGISLVGPATARRFGAVDDRHAVWRGAWNHWSWTVTLQLSTIESAWSWKIDLKNESPRDRHADVVIAQDIGLASINVVRSNESYISHYIDHTVVQHPTWGPVIFSRQNLVQSESRHPWLASACITGVSGFATDAIDVFGRSQRVSGRPEILFTKDLPSIRRQGESACAALQSEGRKISPQASGSFQFAFTFLSNHPDTSSESDLGRVVEMLDANDVKHGIGNEPIRSIWDQPELCHGAEFSREEWNALYPVRRSEEIVGGALWSFFTEDGRHVVSAAKEAAVERSHGHVMSASTSLLPDDTAMGTTVFAPGIFSAQIFSGNPNVNKLLTVVRDPLQRTRGCGQRVWIDAGFGWQLLGSPSAFEMGLRHATWLYVTGERLLEITTRVDGDSHGVTLRCRVRSGDAVRWRITHQLALDANELDSSGSVEIQSESGRMIMRPAADSVTAKRCPDLEFGLSGFPHHEIDRMGTDEMMWSDGVSRGAPYAVAETLSSSDFSIQVSVPGFSPAANREELPAANWKIEGAGEVESLAGILPWFRHDAWIHLAAPHGLEQYGGAAWGVRDVCQGPVEWLLTEQRYAEIREILKVVFAHQYADTGLWPQWFMLGRYADVQQKHCHGDIMFWPLKALCDYAEAANDPGILDLEVPYTDGTSFQWKTESAEPLSKHVDRVIANYLKFCIPGTALVAYGDGDWDDTLQPVHPEMREGMVSAWTVELAHQVFGQLTELYRRAGREENATRMEDLCERIHSDFMKYLMPKGTVAGFAIFRNGEVEPLLHPGDRTSGIRYRLLPMTRGMISGMFDAWQAASHLAIIREHLRCPDGVRLMDHPVAYTGGQSRLFQRGETAAYFGREVSLQYVHAHVRYAEAMTRLGDGDEAWWALQVVNPLGLTERLPIAAPRQANVYFSSSDGDVRDRYEAMKLYDEIRAGRITVKSGWRLYSSGPGLFLHKVRSCLFGIRESYDQIIFDPVLPSHVLPCSIQLQHEGRDVIVRYEQGSSRSITINGQPVNTSVPTNNPYRTGGLSVNRQQYRELLNQNENHVVVTVAR